MDALNSYVGAITKQISCEMREPDSEENSTMNKSSICDESFLKKPDDIKSTSPSPSISIPFSCQNSPLTSPKSLNSPEDELEYLLSSKVEDAFLTKKVDADGIMHPKTNAMESGLTSFECESLSLSPINVFSSTFPSGDHECTESYNYFSTEDAAYCRDIFGFGDSNDLSERITDDQYSKTGDEQRSISTYECKKPLSLFLIVRLVTKPLDSVTKYFYLLRLSNNTGNQYTNNIIDTSIKDTSSTKYRSPPATAPVSFQPSTKCKPLLVTPLNSFNENESSASSSADTTTQKTGISSKSYYLEGSSKNDVVWNRRFLELIEFKKVHGHTNVPQKFEKNPALGAWVARSRLQMRQMEEDEDAANNMSAVQRERVRRLKDIGLVSYLGEYSLQFDIDRIGNCAGVMIYLC